MQLQNTSIIIQLLRERLTPVERAETLIDIDEGAVAGAKKSAVLLPLFSQNRETHLAFIRRSSSLRAHSGEIAFPGGRVDPTDLSPVMTALREAHEEIGLSPERVEVLGLLPPVYTVVTNYLITPVVAFLPQGLGNLQLQASEVAELLLLPLHELADPSIAHTEQWSRNGRIRSVYFYDYGSLRIWGATGRILNQLLDLLQSSF